MKKILVIGLLFPLIFLSACTSPQNEQVNKTQLPSSNTEVGETCSLTATGNTDCETAK